jgi:hypothetical protein
MLLRPQLPQNPTTLAHAPTLASQAHASACDCQRGAAPVEPARRPFPSVAAGAIAAVLLGGVVLTALLTAVAVSAISVAVAAVVLRSLLKNSAHRR